MPTQQGDLSLLNDPVAQQLLHAAIPARVSYTAADGTPRVVPIWFHWDGERIVLGTPPSAPKVKALQHNPHVAVTIDDITWPYKVLLLRGRASVEMIDGLVPEYVLSAKRYFGEEEGKAWVDQVTPLFPQMARISIEPEWVGILDFEQRFPRAIERAMAA